MKKSHQCFRFSHIIYGLFGPFILEYFIYIAFSFQTGYNPNFGSQLINVIEELSRFLDSNKRQALKCNERIYAGLSGIALLNFLNHTRNNSLGCISRNRTIRVSLL